LVVRKIIQIDEDKCTGCGNCVVKCAEGALEIIDGKAKVVKDSFCDGLGACIGECPEDALKIIERDVDEFDECAVAEHQHKKEHEAHAKPEPVMACGCPSSQVQTFSKKQSSRNPALAENPPRLEHWPIQLMLVPETAPFLKGKDLLVLADCAAVAYGNLHRKFIEGNAIVMGCPKFDNAELYVKKLKGMIQNGGIKGIKVAHMEVPCCFGLQQIVDEAIKQSGKKIPMKEYVIGVKGELEE